MEYTQQNVIVTVLRETNSHSFDNGRLVKMNESIM